MNVLAYIPLDLSGPDGLFDTETAEKFIAEGAEERLTGHRKYLRLYLTEEGRWVLGEVEIGTMICCYRQVDDTTARTWLESNGYTKALQRHFS